jgi:hypothetical protein
LISGTGRPVVLLLLVCVSLAIIVRVTYGDHPAPH